MKPNETPDAAPDALPDAPRLLYVSTLDHILQLMLPHLDEAKKRGWRIEAACQVTRFADETSRHVDALHDLPFQRFPLHPKNLTALLRLIRLIRQNQYTLVHAHNPTGGFVGRLAATLARTGSVRVYTAHGFHFHRHGGRVTNFLYRTIEGFGGRFLSDAVFVVNREDYQAAKNTVVPQNRLFLTSGQGVSARDDFNPARFNAGEIRQLRHSLGAKQAAPLLLMVGEMIPRKRHGDLLRAFSLVQKARPDAVLLLAGEGVLRPDLEALAQNLGIAQNVRFLGFRRDIASLLAASDLFMFPSQQEGLPSAIQEALAMATPTIATNVRGCADLVDESCGYLVELGDTENMAQSALAHLEKPAEVRAAMGQAGREKMLRLYDRPKCVAEWFGIYEKLLAERDTRQTRGARR